MPTPRFSDRIGVTEPRRLLQIGEIDAPLRNSLWNWILTLISTEERPATGWKWQEITRLVAQRFVKVPVDDVPLSRFDQARDWLRSIYEQLEWFEAYNLVEFLVRQAGQFFQNWKRDVLAFQVNAVLQEELSAYRFVEGHLAPISTASEVAAIEEALKTARNKGLGGVATHIDTALSLLSRRPTPDYRNSVKESISAVESAARQIAGKGGGLEDALAALEKKGIVLHAAMRKGFVSLYGYTSDDDGIRHAILDAPTVGFDEAKFMLVACSAFATFLMSKAATTGLLK
jgi:hypothetical protein